MMKFLLVFALMFAGSYSYAGECSGNNCSLRNKVVNVTRAVVSVPVTVTRQTVEVVRNVGRRTVARVRNVVR